MLTVNAQEIRDGSVRAPLEAAPARNSTPHAPLKVQSGASPPNLGPGASEGRRGTRAPDGTLTGEAITVLIVDDHPGVRAAIEALIVRTPGLRVVGSVSSGAAAIEDARRLKPTVVIMDLCMPDINGVEATRAIRLDDGAPAVVAFSGSRELWREARDAGCSAGDSRTDRDRHQRRQRGPIRALSRRKGLPQGAGGGPQAQVKGEAGGGQEGAKGVGGGRRRDATEVPNAL